MPAVSSCAVAVRPNSGSAKALLSVCSACTTVRLLLLQQTPCPRLCQLRDRVQQKPNDGCRSLLMLCDAHYSPVCEALQKVLPPADTFSSGYRRLGQAACTSVVDDTSTRSGRTD